MKKIFPFILILFFSCTNLLINKTEYHSIELNGSSWIQVKQGSNYNENNFTIQSWFSGSNNTEVTSTQTIFSMLNESGDILIGIFKDPVYTNKLNIWIDNENTAAIEVSDELSNIDSFNLISIRSDISDNEDNAGLILIDIFINKTKIFSEETSLTTEKLQNIDFIIGGKVSSNPNITYQGQNRDSFWYGCIDEIRLWNIALADSIIQFHNDYPDKLSLEADNDTYDTYLGQLSGLWRFYVVDDEVYSTVPNDACTSIERLYNDNPCSTDSEAIIWTRLDDTVEFSEKHK
tara:strand:+ start:333 stop:1202 length:870 start_codon:yes stop_codon:yes gene_type:complete